MRTTTPGVPAGPPSVIISVRGRPVRCRVGDTVAAALTDAGELGCRETAAGDARGVFCGMGVCFDCLVVVDGVPNTRACMTWVREGLDVRRQDGFGPAG